MLFCVCHGKKIYIFENKVYHEPYFFFLSSRSNNKQFFASRASQKRLRSIKPARSSRGLKIFQQSRSRNHLFSIKKIKLKLFSTVTYNYPFPGVKINLWRAKSYPRQSLPNNNNNKPFELPACGRRNSVKLYREIFGEGTWG